jgi:hypothetical protein
VPLELIAIAKWNKFKLFQRSFSPSLSLSISNQQQTDCTKVALMIYVKVCAAETKGKTSGDRRISLASSERGGVCSSNSEGISL